MPIALTEEQRRQMLVDGFCVIPSFFQVRAPPPLSPFSLVFSLHLLRVLQGDELSAIVEGMESCRGGERPRSPVGHMLTSF